MLTVAFTVVGIPCPGLNGGPMVGNGGTERQCGWYKDRWGLSGQITPRANRMRLRLVAMMTMKRIDIAVIEAARRG